MAKLFVTRGVTLLLDYTTGTILVSGKILWHVKARRLSGSHGNLRDLANMCVRIGELLNWI
jgi:hypothetical protein